MDSGQREDLSACVTHKHGPVSYAIVFVKIEFSSMGKMDVSIDHTFNDLCIKENFPCLYVHFLNH